MSLSAEVRDAAVPAKRILADSYVVEALSPSHHVTISGVFMFAGLLTFEGGWVHGTRQPPRPVPYPGYCLSRTMTFLMAWPLMSCPV